jgi:hypothetical protein
LLDCFPAREDGIFAAVKPLRQFFRADSAATTVNDDRGKN